jgi:exodeoxyribonuclease V alpha subunit
VAIAAVQPRVGPGTKHDSPAVPDREVLAGLVERVTFHSAESGFCVLRIKARGHRDLITIVGHAASISAGEFVQATGVWNNDRTHGLQFKASFLRTTMPTTAEGIEKYLGSGMIRGIGPVYAKKLVKAFGADVFDVIEREADRLREVPGIGPVRVKRIISGWADQKVIREIMLFLHSHGVGTSRSVRIFKTYGADAIQLISENPYRLARDIRGIGLRTADQVARRLGIEPRAMIRVRAGISFALAEATGEGHCGLPVAELTALTGQLLEVPAALIEAALRLELEAGEVVADALEGQRCVFLAGLYRAEQAIAERLRTLAVGQPPWPPVEVEKAIPWVQEKTGLALAASQREALRLALGAKLLVITGGPGVGKTTLVQAILQVLRAKRVAPPSGSPKAPGWRHGPSTGCSRRTRRPAASSGTRRTRSTATCWWWTRPAWWTCR